MNGCHLLIGTPACLLRLLRRGHDTFLQLRRVCHLVLDDAHLLAERCTEPVRTPFTLTSLPSQLQPQPHPPQFTTTRAVPNGVLNRDWAAPHYPAPIPGPSAGREVSTEPVRFARFYRALHIRSRYE